MARENRKQRQLFRTTDPSFRRPEWAVGQLLDHQGRLYRVTRWVERPPVHLVRGGTLREWEVWGRPVSDQELEEELAGAAERMLAESEHED